MFTLEEGRGNCTAKGNRRLPAPSKNVRENWLEVGPAVRSIKKLVPSPAVNPSFLHPRRKLPEIKRLPECLKC